MKMLTRRGVRWRTWARPMWPSPMRMRTRRGRCGRCGPPLSLTGAFGPRAGQKVFTLRERCRGRLRPASRCALTSTAASGSGLRVRDTRGGKCLRRFRSDLQPNASWLHFDWVLRKVGQNTRDASCIRGPRGRVLHRVALRRSAAGACLCAITRSTCTSSKGFPTMAKLCLTTVHLREIKAQPSDAPGHSGWKHLSQLSALDRPPSKSECRRQCRRHAGVQGCCSWS
jgi:hypothetical protein